MVLSVVAISNKSKFSVCNGWQSQTVIQLQEKLVLLVVVLFSESHPHLKGNLI